MFRITSQAISDKSSELIFRRNALPELTTFPRYLDEVATRLSRHKGANERPQRLANLAEACQGLVLDASALYKKVKLLGYRSWNRAFEVSWLKAPAAGLYRM